MVCLSGERLSMRGGSGGGSVYGESGVPHSTFTAFLMQETGLWYSYTAHIYIQSNSIIKYVNFETKF